MPRSYNWVPSLKFSHLNLSYIDCRTFLLPPVSNPLFLSVITFDDSTNHEAQKLLIAFKNCCFVYNFGVEIQRYWREGICFWPSEMLLLFSLSTLSLAPSASLSQHVRTHRLAVKLTISVTHKNTNSNRLNNWFCDEAGFLVG